MTLQQFYEQKIAKHSFRPYLVRRNRGDRYLATGLTTIVGLMAVHGLWAQNVQAQASDVISQQVVLQQAPRAALPQAMHHGAPQVANGVYLFGDTTTPGQLGHEYMVLQVKGSDVIGGFYELDSSFSCFSGTITAQELSLQVQDPQRPDRGLYQVPIYLDNQSATSRFVLPYENSLGLQGTYRIDGMGQESQRILDVCRASQSLSQRFEPAYRFLSPGSIISMTASTR